MTDTRNIDETISNALEVTVPQTMDLVLPTNEVIKVQMVDGGPNMLMFIAGIMAIIAILNLIVLISNNRIEHKRRRDELYDRRWPLYVAARNFLSSLMRGHKIDEVELQTFQLSKLDAVLLFDESVADYLSGLYEKALKVQFHELSSEGDDDRDKHLEKAKDLKTELLNELLERQLEARFKPYLQLT